MQGKGEKKICIWVLIVVACIGLGCLLYFLLKKKPTELDDCSCVNGDCVQKTEKERMCRCDYGWSGKFCNTPEIYCRHGTAPLTRPTVCTCDNGWTGSRCEEYATCTQDLDCNNTNMKCINKVCALQTYNQTNSIDCKIPDGIQYPDGGGDIKKYCSMFQETTQWKTPLGEDVHALGIQTEQDLRDICSNISFKSCNDMKQLKALQYLYRKYGNSGEKKLTIDLHL